jgi:exonuclease III
MKFITWNIRGLNGRSKQRILCNCIKTKTQISSSSKKQNARDRPQKRSSENVGATATHTTQTRKVQAGGLAILWNPNSVILNQGLSTPGSLTAHYRAIGSDKDGWITNAYGPQIIQEKELFLQNLAYLSSIAKNQRWIVGGDFNMILTLEEKRGGKKRLEQDSIKFQEFLDLHKLVDIENGNGTFTWMNKRTGPQQIACRLDRFLLSETLLLEGPLIESNILPKPGSDHWPVQLWVDTMASPKLKPFRFEKFWLSHPDFQNLARHWWDTTEIQQGTKMYCFQQKLKYFKQQVRKWNKEVFGNIFQERKLLEQKLEALQKMAIQTGYTPNQQQEEQQTRQQLEERLKQEEILWRQKSRIQWLKEGEKNTKFFHRSMIHRRFINRITKLENAQGSTLLTHQDITQELTDYYQDLLSEPPVNRAEAIGRVTTNILTLITQEQNEALMTPISQAEVDQAIQELPTGKAPGPDGFTMDFFHSCWPMLREEVWQLVEESRSSGKVLPALNATFLTLIPKEERVTNLKNFRPIALCNVIYKIISKVIALRLKPILPFIISKEQSGYVEGRQIMDSIILVHEVIHSLKSHMYARYASQA